MLCSIEAGDDVQRALALKAQSVMSLAKSTVRTCRYLDASGFDDISGR
jgi:hypothetical protein